MHGRRDGAAGYAQRAVQVVCAREHGRDHDRDKQRRGEQRACLRISGERASLYDAVRKWRRR
eukprot:3266276-Pleurochrysis_carterae.AAC.1